MRALLLVTLAACGGPTPPKRWLATQDIAPHALGAAARFNAAIGCALAVIAVKDGEGARRNRVQEVYFTEAMNNAFDGFTDREDAAETDIMVRPKPLRVVIDGRAFTRPPPDYVSTIVHEMGHAFGLEHVSTPGELMHVDGGDSSDPEVMARFAELLRKHAVQCKDMYSEEQLNAVL